MYIFLDESGDLGFGERSSSWFLFTILLTNNHRPIEKIVKRVHKNLRKKYRYAGELHAYHAQDVTRKRVLRELASLEDVHILSIILNKKKVYVDLQNQKNLLYNYTANILLDRVYNKSIIPDLDGIKLFIDQKDTNKNLKENFQKYLTVKMQDWRHANIHIKIKPSHTEKCLQAVDFVSWAIFRKYERSDYEFYDIIKSKIIEEKLLFP